MAQEKDPFIPTLIGENTQAKVYEQGYTYDQAGMTYDQAGVAYGGVYDSGQDIVPLVSLVDNIVPSIWGNSDLYTPGKTNNNNNNIGPGWFMYINLT